MPTSKSLKNVRKLCADKRKEINIEPWLIQIGDAKKFLAHLLRSYLLSHDLHLVKHFSEVFFICLSLVSEKKCYVAPQWMQKGKQKPKKTARLKSVEVQTVDLRPSRCVKSWDCPPTACASGDVSAELKIRRQAAESFANARHGADSNQNKGADRSTWVAVRCLIYSKPVRPSLY